MEEWRNLDILPPHYFVSNRGRFKNTRTDHIHSGWVNPKGYRVVSVPRNNTTETYLLHRLVAMAFIPNLRGLPQVNHKDCNKQNNCVTNLEWCDNQENISHAYANNRLGKLTAEQRDDIVRLRDDLGFKFVEIANMYGVNESSIRGNYNRRKRGLK